MRRRRGVIKERDRVTGKRRGEGERERVTCEGEGENGRVEE